MSNWTATFPEAVEEAAFAYEAVAFFRKHMDRHGLSPADLTTPEAFRRLPPTVKADYRRDFPAGVLATGRSLHDRFILKSQSSGTGGERLVSVSHTFDLARRMSATVSVHGPLARQMERFRHQRVCRYAAPNCSDVECASPFTTMADRILPDATLVLPVAHDLLTTPARMVDQAIAEIGDYLPHWFYADTTHLAFLVRQLRARDLPAPECRTLLLTYTRATRVGRRQLADFFPPDTCAAEVVSMSEVGWLAMECPLGQLHLNTDAFYMELLAGNEPVGRGEWGELVVTTLGDRLSPHIRYRTGDVYRLDDPCPCRHRFPAVSHQGRWRDMLIRDGEVVLSPHGLDEMVGSSPWLDVYRMSQPRERRFRLKLITNDCYRAGDEAGLAGRLEAVLGSDARLEVELCDYIPSERTGKFVSCVSAEAERRFADNERWIST
jgi:phenylacetate-CoA ligase